MRVSPADRQILADCATVVAVGAVAKWAWDALATARTWHPDMMSDGLPLYLTAMTARRGGDPTVADALAQTYAEQGLGAQAHMFSTLYPASTAAIFQPFVPDSWADFTEAWRVVLIVAAIVAGAAGGASGVRRDRMLLAAALGAVVTTIGFPTALTCARLGQVNQLLAAGAGLSQLAVGVGFAGLGVGLLVVGGGIKLVPLLAAWPFVAGARLRALLVGVATGLGVLALTATQVPLARAIGGVLHTLRFESGTSRFVVAGLSPADPRWMTVLVEARHFPLALLTVALAGFAGWRSRPGALHGAAGGTGAREGAQALVGGVALVFAWLGADAAAQHELYLPLVLSALAWAVTWPLAEGAPRASIGASAVLIATLAVFPAADGPVAFRSVVVGEIVWLVTAARLLWECGGLGRRERIVFGSLVAIALGLAARPLLDAGGGPRGPTQGIQVPGAAPGADKAHDRHTPSLPPGP